MLEVNQLDVIFESRDDHFIPCQLEIKNNSNLLLAYKIKSTNAECFIVRPNRGLLHGQQKEYIEFSVNTNSRKSINPKDLVNEKFQISAIKLYEKKSFAEIDNLFKTEQIQTVRLLTKVYTMENGMRVQVQNEKHVQSVYQQFSRVRQDIGSSIYQSQSRIENSNTQVQELSNKLQIIEKNIRNARVEREQLFMAKQLRANKKKSSKLIKLVVPIVMGLIAAQIYQQIIGL